MKTIIKTSLTAIVLISAPSLFGMTAATEKHEAKQQEQRDLLSSHIDLTLQAIEQLQQRLDKARQQKAPIDQRLVDQALALILKGRTLIPKSDSSSSTGYHD
jgi:hypothetical protein